MIKWVASLLKQTCWKTHHMVMQKLSFKRIKLLLHQRANHIMNLWNVQQKMYCIIIAWLCGIVNKTMFGNQCCGIKMNTWMIYIHQVTTCTHTWNSWLCLNVNDDLVQGLVSGSVFSLVSIHICCWSDLDWTNICSSAPIWPIWWYKVT